MKIALCNHKMTLKYNNQEKEWSYLVERNRTPIRTAETVLEYIKMTKDERDAAKDVGGYFGGWLKNGLRRSGCVECRSFGMLHEALWLLLLELLQRSAQCSFAFGVRCLWR